MTLTPEEVLWNFVGLVCHKHNKTPMEKVIPAFTMEAYAVEMMCNFSCMVHWEWKYSISGKRSGIGPRRASQVALEVKNPPGNVGDIRDADSIPASGRSPQEGNGNPLQYSCLENSIDRGAWWATVRGVTKSQTWLKRLSTGSKQMWVQILHLPFTMYSLPVYRN